MLKFAWRAYVKTFQLKSIKEAAKKDFSIWLLPLFWLLINPIFVVGAENVLDFYLGILYRFVPMIIMAVSNISSKFLMSKSLFLTPMSFADRKDYLQKVLLMKIGVPVLVGMGIECIRGIWFGFSLGQLLAMSFLHISQGISIYLCVETIGKNDARIQWARRKKDGSYGGAWLNLINFALILLLLVGLEEGELAGEWSGIIICWLGVILVLDILIVSRQYEDTIEYLGDYERYFNILGKVS